MKTYILIISIAAVIVSACSPLQAQGAQPTVQDVVEPQSKSGEPIETVVQEGKNEVGGAVLIYERSGGLKGEMTKITFYADGRVESQDGTVTTVEASQVLGLLRDIEALGFFDLEDSYGKFSPCNDCFTHTVTVITSDRSKTVTAKDGNEAPQEFWSIVSKIVALLPPEE